MANILSQEEVDSLLGGMDKGKVKTEADIPERDEAVKVFDFSRQAAPTHLMMPTLGIIDERFIGFSTTSLSAATRSVIDIVISSTETVKFSEFSRSISLPTTLNIFKMEPLRGFAILVLEGSLVFAFVDTFFGGKEKGHARLERKVFTAIETKIVDKIVKVILGDLERAWSEVYKAKIVFVRSEIDPKFAEIISPDDVVIASRFNVHLENASGVMSICIPYSTIEPIREKLMRKFRGERLEVDQRWRRYIEKKIKKLTINLSCTLGMVKITGRELLEMKVGDVIQFDQRISDPVIVSVEGVPKFKGYPGSYNNYRAVRLSKGIN